MIKLPPDTPPVITQADIDEFKRKKKAGTLPPKPKKPVHPIRPDAVRWLVSHYGGVAGPICTSKFYEPKESWTKRRVWFFEFPISFIQAGKETNIHFVCQIASNKNEFHYLKVPVTYFQANLQNLKVRNNAKISLFLSAEPKNIYVDERGDGKVNFSKFLIPNKKA